MRKLFISLFIIAVLFIFQARNNPVSALVTMSTICSWLRWAPVGLTNTFCDRPSTGKASSYDALARYTTMGYCQEFQQDVCAEGTDQTNCRFYYANFGSMGPNGEYCYWNGDPGDGIPDSEAYNNKAMCGYVNGADMGASVWNFNECTKCKQDETFFSWDFNAKEAYISIGSDNWRPKMYYNGTEARVENPDSNVDYVVRIYEDVTKNGSTTDDLRLIDQWFLNGTSGSGHPNISCQYMTADSFSTRVATSHRVNCKLNYIFSVNMEVNKRYYIRTWTKAAYAGDNAWIEKPACGSSFDSPVITITPTPAPALSCAAKNASDINTNIMPSGSNVSRGQEFNYIISVTNNSSTDATGVYVIDKLPKGIDFLRISDVNCRVIAGATSTAGQQVQCDIGNVSSFGRKTFGFVVKVRSDAPFDTNLTDSAAVFPVPDLTATKPCTHTVKIPTTTTITPTPPPPALSCTSKTANVPNGATVSRGQSLTYNIAYQNSSNTGVNGVYVNDQLPRYIEFVSGTSCSVIAAATSTTGQKVRCNIGFVGGNQKGSVAFNARVRTDAPASSTQLDSAAIYPVSGTSNTCTHSVKVAVTPSITITPTPSKTRTPTPTGVQTACENFAVRESSGSWSKIARVKFTPSFSYSILKTYYCSAGICNMEAMDNPYNTNEVYLVANTVSGKNTTIYILNKGTGAITPKITLKNDPKYGKNRKFWGLSFRPGSSNIVWGWTNWRDNQITKDPGDGLYTINLSTGDISQVLADTRLIDTLAWDNTGTYLYAAGGRNLYRFKYASSTSVDEATGSRNSSGRQVYPAILPGKTDAMDMTADGKIIAYAEGGEGFYFFNVGDNPGHTGVNYPITENTDGFVWLCGASPIAGAVGAASYTTAPAVSCNSATCNGTLCGNSCSASGEGVNGGQCVGNICKCNVCPQPTTGVSGPTPTRTPTPGAGGGGTSVSVIPQEDAYVSAANPSTNYGGSTVLQVDANSNGSPFKITYLKFNLNVSQLIGKTITSVKLRLRISESSSATQQVKLVNTNSWSESTINFNNKPSLGSTTIASNNGGNLDTFKEIALPISAVKSRIGQIMSLAMDTGSTDGFYFRSSEYTTNTSYRPQLVITYK